MFCNNCGHENPRGANFCSSCGTALRTRHDDPATVTLQVDALSGTEEISVDLDESAGGGVLVISRGRNAGARFTLEGPFVTAGRHPDSDIFLDDVTVSRRHVEFTRQPTGVYRVRDVGSLNGTYLNRERIEEAELTSGDELQIGKFRLVFLDDGLIGGRPS